MMKSLISIDKSNESYLLVEIIDSTCYHACDTLVLRLKYAYMRTISFAQSVQWNKKEREAYIVSCMLSEKRLRKPPTAHTQTTTFVLVNHKKLMHRNNS